MPTKIRDSSGNVFRDLGFSAGESEHFRLRSDLMIELDKLIKRRRLTQAKAAALFGVSQPRVSDLVRGRIERFSVDRLVAMLGSAGVRVELVVKPSLRLSRKPAPRGELPPRGACQWAAMIPAKWTRCP